MRRFETVCDGLRRFEAAPRHFGCVVPEYAQHKGFVPSFKNAAHAPSAVPPSPPIIFGVDVGFIVYFGSAVRDARVVSAMREWTTSWMGQLRSDSTRPALEPPSAIAVDRNAYVLRVLPGAEIRR